MTIPTQPKIYHITHVENLSGILKTKALLSDAIMLSQGGPTCSIGISNIKRRRLREIEVRCHPGTKVGEYVPFYFCPRSVMLYVISCGNHPELSFRDGQDSIIHLELDLFTVIHWADQNNVRWAFSLSNAGAYYTEFRSSVESLQELDWAAIQARDFRDPDVKERKQAEFLLYNQCPWHLVERIGTINRKIAQRVYEILQDSEWKPKVECLPIWYY